MSPWPNQIRALTLSSDQPSYSQAIGGQHVDRRQSVEVKTSASIPQGLPTWLHNSLSQIISITFNNEDDKLFLEFMVLEPWGTSLF
jgi:hypothetical protein